MTERASLKNLTVIDHPLIRHKVRLLRSKTTEKKLFCELVDEIAMLMAYEVTRDLEEEPAEVAAEQAALSAAEQAAAEEAAF